MPDVHLGNLVNNGSVVATSHLVFPQAVGGDIGCGLSAICFHSTAEFLESESHARHLLQKFYHVVPALKHRGPQVLPGKLKVTPLSDTGLVKQSQRDGA